MFGGIEAGEYAHALMWAVRENDHESRITDHGLPEMVTRVHNNASYKIVSMAIRVS